CTEVEGEVHDGREPVLGLGGEYRTVAQRGIECGAQVLAQEGLALFFGDGRMVELAEPAVADSPVAGWADVRVCAALRIGLGHPVEALEALGQFDGRLRDRNHARIRSKTRPRNQKLSTPAHSAWSASVQAACTAGIQSTPAPTAPTKAAVLAAQYSAMNQSVITGRTLMDRASA